MKLFSIDFDKVIKGRFISASATYKFALEKLAPLIDRLDIQRNIQDSKFYSRLEKDILKGCIMPPLTLAFIDPSQVEINSESMLLDYIESNIENGFILDGIQRLNTLNRAYKNQPDKLDLERTIYLNILICASMDNLLYRMITLNNGQKPMSARHQIEILSANIFEFEDSEYLFTEKDIRAGKKYKIRFNKADFTKGYLGYLSNSTNIENQKIIEEKLDALIAEKILDSKIVENETQFTDILNLILRLSENPEIFKWFRNTNNLIGFCVGIKSSFEVLKDISDSNFLVGISNFEKAFGSFNLSKIKVGRIRKDLVKYFIEKYLDLENKEEYDLVDILSQVD